MSIRIRNDAQKFKVQTSALTTSATAITIQPLATSVMIYNPDSTNSIKYSFDGSGGTYATIPPSSSLAFDCDNFPNRNTLHLKTSSGSITAEITTAYEI